MAKEQRPITVRQQIIDAVTPEGKWVDNLELKKILGINDNRFEWNVKDAVNDGVLLKRKIVGKRKSRARVEYSLNPNQHHPERWHCGGIIEAMSSMDTLVRQQKENSDGA